MTSAAEVLRFISVWQADRSPGSNYPPLSGFPGISTTSVEAPKSSQPGEHRQEPKGVFGSCFTLDILIDGVKTRCLLDTGPEVTTMSETHFKRQFGGTRLSSAKWVKLTAVNRLDIPVVGCLYAGMECLGMKLPRKCVFVLRDDVACNEEKSVVPGILGMNVLSGLRSLFSGLDDVQMMNLHKQPARNVNLHHVFTEMEREEQYCGPAGKIGYVKVVGRRAIVIPLCSETVIEGRCRVPPKTSS
ncbi:hypothetical protein SKAU_G00175100 [Synaphobranchus kaupii]|uniref:Uncharacterized protein n=1 Tax=Synaphobranchus kaupii TaxID=118154 RepID=A0A9Q1FL73_SYNKA|nr:hypothetical protein SKAU_G00175100 [Synaphobranchus kaupii]